MLLSLGVTLLAVGVPGLVVRREWRAEYDPEPGARREGLLHLAALALRLGALLGVLAVCLAIGQPVAALVLAVLVGQVWAIHETLDLVAWKYLNLPFRSVARHAPMKAGDADLLPNLVKTVRTYVPRGSYLRLAGAGLVATVLVAAPWGLLRPADLLAGVAGLLLAAVVLRFWAGRVAAGVVARPSEQAFLVLDGALPQARLAAADRSGACAHLAGRTSAARHVVVILNESAGDDISCHDGQALWQAICAAGGDATEWMRPSNAVTPSSCTDIALPCLFTGCAPQDSVETLHRMPLLFDLAKARGMTTLFYSASILRWGNLEAFFGAEGGAIDEVVSPHSTGLPLVNELGSDDYLMAQGLHDRILGTEGPLFVVLYNNGLHLPFQNDSALPIPDHITDRRARAAHIVTEAHRLVFDALRQTGRYDDTLILSVGDHGETFGVAATDRSGKASRLTKLSEAITRPLFLIKPPKGFDPARRDCLAANMERLVSLIDIAPTLASVLGVGLAADLPAPAGYDLTRETVPQDRMHLTLTVNEWRDWPQAAVMLARENLRVCVDYQTTLSLCCTVAGQPLPAADRVAADALLEQALAVPVARKVIARVFRDKLHNRGRMQGKGNAPVGPDVRRPRAIAGGDDLFFGAGIVASDAGLGRLHYAGDTAYARGFGLGADDRGIVVYGPYTRLAAGRYAASYVFARGAGRQPVVIDVCAQGLPVLARAEIGELADGRVATITFDLPRQVEGLEVRLHSYHGFSGTCEGLFLTRIGPAAA